MVHFFASTRHRFKNDVEGLSGALIFASGIPLHEMQRRDFRKYPHAARRLLDPQLYLSSLDVAKAEGACTKLASYGWFGPLASQYESAKQKQAEWRRSAAQEVADAWTGQLPADSSGIEDRVRICVEVQSQLGCEALILPSPLITGLSEHLPLQLAWLDAGLALSSRICPSLGRFATIAITDNCLRGLDPWSSAELDTLIDQISARAPEGAYIVLEQSSHDQTYESNVQVIGTLVRLVRDLREAGVQRVIVPAAGVAGMLGVAVGAEIWSTGWYRSQRRIRLSDFEDSTEQKRAVPTYYSHQLAGDVHLKADLDSINEAGLLGAVADRTSASAGLLRALENGSYVSNVPEWEPRASNVTAACEHFVESLIRETAALRRLSVDQRMEACKRWLDNAIKVAQRVSASGEFNARTALSHQRPWRSVLEIASSR